MVEERSLEKRDYISLWNGTGPIVTDVKQGKSTNFSRNVVLTIISQ